MLYLTSRLHSPNQFDADQDPQLWRQLVSEMRRIDESIWKIWTITDVFPTRPTESYVCSYGPGWGWAPAEIVAQSAPSYLQIEQAPGQTTFTIASASQSALQNLQALVANLYEPVTPAGLDVYLDPNQDISFKLVELFDRETGERVRQTFVQPVNSTIIFSQFPLTRWDVLNLSVIPQIEDPLPVLKLQIKPQANQAWFMLGGEEQFLSRPEHIQARDLFTLADMAFRGLIMPAPVGA